MLIDRQLVIDLDGCSVLSILPLLSQRRLNPLVLGEVDAPPAW